MIPRYTRPEMRRIWSSRHMLELWLLVEIAVTQAWYGNTDGINERDIASVKRLRSNTSSWLGRPYHRWGWVDVAPLVDEPIYYLEFVCGPLHGYGLQAAVTARGRVLTSSYLWQS